MSTLSGMWKSRDLHRSRDSLCTLYSIILIYIGIGYTEEDWYMPIESYKYLIIYILCHYVCLFSNYQPADVTIKHYTRGEREVPSSKVLEHMPCRRVGLFN